MSELVKLATTIKPVLDVLQIFRKTLPTINLIAKHIINSYAIQILV